MTFDLGDKTVVLLGAGASVDAQIPGSFKMTKCIAENAVTRSPNDRFRKALTTVLDGILNRAGTMGKIPTLDAVDIETVLSAFDFLARRNELEFAPFVGSWHPAIEALDRGEIGEYQTHQADEFARLVANDLSGGGGAVFRDAAARLIREVERLVWIDPKSHDSQKRIAYLEPLVRAAARRKLTVATLNYDNCIDLACSSCDISCDDGITGWSHSHQINFCDDGLRLLRLHGSVMWRNFRGGDQELVRLLPPEHGDNPESAPSSEPYIVFGRHNKLRASGPLLDVLSEFMRALERADHVISVGYSGRDEHINALVRRFITRKVNPRITYVGPDRSERTDLPYSYVKMTAREFFATVE